MGTEANGNGKIKVDEHYPSEIDEPPPFDVKKIENIRLNVKFDTLYQVSKLLGDGKFGKVYSVIEKATGHEFAAKFIKIRKEADRAEVEREVSILTQLRHPRIAQIYDAFYTTTNDVVLIMEIVRGGELFDRVAEESYELSELAVVMIICQLCEAIDYIHKQNILHLDVKPENIMCVSLTGNRIKLIDFGLARHYDGTQELKYMAGTPEFAAPEVIKFEKLDYHTDMWSIGVITYILLSGYSPFLGDNLGETYCNVEKGEWEFTEEFDTVSPEAKDFVTKLIIYDQKKRMLPHECLEHPWIAKHRQKAACNSILEKPLNAPQLDNKKIMRYNTRRKFKRIVIYVKFLIEMNRLRNSLKTRMSSNGHKFFDPLFKMAEKKEMKIAEACNSSLPTTSMGMNSSSPRNVGESKRKGSEATQLSQLEKIREEENEKVEEKTKKNDETIPVKKTSTTRRPKTKRDAEVDKTVTKTEKPAKTPVDGEKVEAPKPKAKVSENGTVVVKKKKVKTAEVEEKPKPVETAEQTPTTLAPKKSVEKKEKEKDEKPAISKSRSSKTEASKVPEKPEAATVSTLKETGKKVKTESHTSKTDVVESTKENKSIVEGKPPTRQAAIRKRDKSKDRDNVLNYVLQSTTLLKTTAVGTPVEPKMAETAKIVVKEREKLASRKKKSSTAADDETISAVLNSVKIEKKKSSVVHETAADSAPSSHPSIKSEKQKLNHVSGTNTALPTNLLPATEKKKASSLIEHEKSIDHASNNNLKIEKLKKKSASLSHDTDAASPLLTASKSEKKKSIVVENNEVASNLRKSEKKKVCIAPEVGVVSLIEHLVKVDKKKVTVTSEPQQQNNHLTPHSHSEKKSSDGENGVVEEQKEKRKIKKHIPSSGSKEMKEMKETSSAKVTTVEKKEVEEKALVEKHLKADGANMLTQTAVKKAIEPPEPAIATPLHSLKKSSIKKALAKSNLDKDKKEPEIANEETTSKVKTVVKRTGADTPIVSGSKLANGDKAGSEHKEKEKPAIKVLTAKKPEPKLAEPVANPTTSLAPRASSLKKTPSLSIPNNEIPASLTHEPTRRNTSASLKLKESMMTKTSKSNADNFMGVQKAGEQSSSSSDVASVSTKNSSEERKKVRFFNDTDASPSSSSQSSSLHPPKPAPLFGSGLQKMKSESCIHSKIHSNGTPKRNRDDSSLTRKGSLFDNDEIDEEFSYENLREKLNRRVSGADDDFLKKPKKPISIPPTNSVKDRLKQFEKKFSK